MERRLAAILAADFVGYSPLIEANEVGTLTVPKARRKTAPARDSSPLRVIRYRGDPTASPAMSAVTPIADQIPHRSETTLSAMCGRLPVGKDFLHVCSWVGAAMCSAYFARFT